MADDPLFLDDKATAKKIGLRAELAPSVFQVLEKKGFPRPDPLFEDKRYWPAVRAFLDRRYNVNETSGPLTPDGKENWDKTPKRVRKPKG